MTSARVARVLAWFVGVTFIAMGIAEVVVRISSDDPIEMDALAFWFFSLCGGGTLVLVGSFALAPSGRMSVVFVVAGCLAGMLATMWTLVLPILALTLLILTVSRAGEDSNLRPTD